MSLTAHHSQHWIFSVSVNEKIDMARQELDWAFLEKPNHRFKPSRCVSNLAPPARVTQLWLRCRNYQTSVLRVDHAWLAGIILHLCHFYLAFGRMQPSELLWEEMGGEVVGKSTAGSVCNVCCIDIT